MNNILVVGDPHFKTNNLIVMREFVRKMKILVSQKTREKANYFNFMVCLGDTLHTHNKIDQSCLKLATEFFKEMANYMHVYILIGNHDRPREDTFLTNDHPFHGLESYRNITIVWKVIEYKDPISECRFIFVPYVSNGRFRESLKTLETSIEKDRPEVIFAHQEFKGCNKAKDIISETGDVWNEDEPLIISGHIHDYHMPQKNIIYMGTPVQHTFGESTKKAVGLFKFSKGNYSGNRMELGLTKKKTIKTTIKNILNIDIDDTAENRIIIECKREDMKGFEQTNHYKKFIKNNVKICYNFVKEKKNINNSNKTLIDLMREKCNINQNRILDELI